MVAAKNTIHLLKIRGNGASVYWPCVPQINQTGYCRPLSETSTFESTLVTCRVCRAAFTTRQEG